MVARRSLALSLLFLALLSVAGLCFAQGYRYMDGSGTIHFADSISEVPRQYRHQIYPPTPTPVLDKRGQAQARRAQQEELARQERAEREKKREAEQRRLERERQIQREERELRRREQETSISRGYR